MDLTVDAKTQLKVSRGVRDTQVEQLRRWQAIEINTEMLYGVSLVAKVGW